MIVSYFMLLHTGCSKAEKSENSFYDEDKYCKVAKKQYYMIPFILQFATR